MAKDPDIVLALESAITKLQYIEENQTGIAEFREPFPSVIDELNEATCYLNTQRMSSANSPIFLDN
jgi:hypothetical protein